MRSPAPQICSSVPVVSLPSFVTEVDGAVVDTAGYAFTFRVVSIFSGVNIGAYIHHPTISTGVVHGVESRVALRNDSDSVSSSAFLTRGKLLRVAIFPI